MLWYRPGYSRELDLLRRGVRRMRRGALPPPGPGALREKAFADPRLRRLWVATALADALVHHVLKVRAHLAVGRTVVADRWVDDGLLDLELRFPELDVPRRPAARLLRRLSARPDRAFLLMLPLEAAEARLAAKAEPFPDPPELRAARHRAYSALAATGRYDVVDAGGPVDAVQREIAGRLPPPRARSGRSASASG